MSTAPLILLTGASGFLGRALVRALEVKGCTLRLLQHRAALPRGRHEIVHGSIVDGVALRAAAKGCDIVVHAAALASEFAPAATDFERCNIEGTRVLLEAAQAAKVRRLLHVSSVMAFGPSAGRVCSEADFDAGRSVSMPYQRTKRTATQIVRAARGGGMEVAVVYPAALIGIGPSSEGNWMGRLAEHLVARRLGALPRVQQQRFCLAHVDDVAEAIAVAALRRGDDDWILGGENLAVAELYEVLRSELGDAAMPALRPAWLLHGALGPMEWWARLRGRRPVSTRAGLAAFRYDWAFSSTKARAELGLASRPVVLALREQMRAAQGRAKASADPGVESAEA